MKTSGARVAGLIAAVVFAGGIYALLGNLSSAQAGGGGGGGGGGAGASQPATGSQPATTTQGARGRGARRGGGGAPATRPTPTLGLENGTLDLDTPDFTLKLVKTSQTIAALEPKGAVGFNNQPFDFTPADQLSVRSGDGFHHLGDISLRIQQAGWQEGAWVDLATSNVRKPVNALPAQDRTLAAADVTPSISGYRVGDTGRTLITESPLQVTRSWRLDNGRLVLHFDIKNTSASPVQVGALGIPMIFNNIITNFNSAPPNYRARTLAQAHEICSFFDPYIGQDAGYLQVTRLNGKGPALVVAPEGKTPFEAWRTVTEPYGISQTFEGAFEWVVHSQGLADVEWARANPRPTPWNPPTSETIAPGATVSHGIKLLVSDQIRNIEKTLAANSRPVAVGIPGYIVPMDQDAKLFLNYGSHKVSSIESDPPGAVTADTNPAKNGWLDYTIHGKGWGRARLTVTYDDGTKQAVSYYVIKPAAQAVSDLGNFLFTKMWYEDPNDPFKRSPSIMTYDRVKNQIVTQDLRVWIAGLGDEGGSSWLSGALKEFGQPKREEIAKYEQFIDKVLWGGLQVKDGPRKYGVLKSMFYYDPPQLPGFPYDQSIRWPTAIVDTNFPAWTKNWIGNVYQRAYNYPHVVAAYWCMYQLARNNNGLVTNHDWKWYLDQAYQTTNFMLNARDEQGRAVGYVDTGLMEGDIFLLLLKDLQREGWSEQAGVVEAGMKRRTEQWTRQAFPFGSEMAWDSTGQEEVYAWTTYFGYNDKAQVTLDSILGYMPTLPHWGYNGNARRYWDFLYGGAPNQGYERQIHHYGSGINAIPALVQYRQHPDDLYLLRIGYGGTMGPMSNIDQEGFGSAAFHTYPQNLRWDAYSGDYAQNFFGHTLNAATYLINHPDFGWQAFGGNVKVEGDAVRVQVLDSFRRRIYIAPLGLYVTLDAGAFQGFEVNAKTHAVRLALAPSTEFTPIARLRIEQPAKLEGVGTFKPVQGYSAERDAFSIPLDKSVVWVELTETK